MSPDVDSEENPWDRFDHALELAGNRLEAARSRYEALVDMNAAPPDEYVSALREIEADADAIGSTLDVDAEDAAEAESVADRAELLADVLDAMWTFHTALLDVELDVYRTWHASFEGVDAVDPAAATDGLDSLTEFADNENYTQFRRGEQFTLRGLRGHLDEAESTAMELMAPMAYVERCVGTVEEYEDQFTADLRRLVDVDAQVQIKTDRAAVTDAKERLSDGLDEGRLDEQAKATARYALEGAMMLKYYTGYAKHAFEYCRRLAEVLERVEGVDAPGEGLVQTRAIEALTSRVEAAIVEATTKTDVERVVDLLHEHDGSLARAVDASEMDVETFFEGVQTAFEDGQITDVRVTFE